MFARRRVRADRQQHPVALEDIALMGVVQRRQLDLLPGDVAPHIQLGPVAEREHPHVLTGSVLAVVKVPQLGSLVARVPLAELVTQAEDALLRARLLFVAPPAAEDGVEAVLGDGIEQRQGLQRVARAVGSIAQTTIVDVVLHRRDVQPRCEPGHGGIAVREHLRKVVPSIDM